MKKCLYCKSELSQDSILDFCENCGEHIFGKKMFNAIVKNMGEAKERGDLNQVDP